MITERGIVTVVESNRITVLCRSRMDCLRCAEGKGCGGGILARWLGDRQFQLQAYYDSETSAPKVGGLVEISLPANRLVGLATLMYGLPLVLMLLFLLIQVGLFPNVSELVSILCALIGLFAGFKLAQIFVARANQRGALLPRLQSTESGNQIQNGLACASESVNS